MTTKSWAIAIMLVVTLLTSTAQIFYKFGADRLSLSLQGIVLNGPLIAGLALYAVGAVLLIFALRHGEVSVLYPIVATSYIWVSLLSVIYLQERMNVFKWLGVATIFVGIILITSQRTKTAVPMETM